MHAVRVLVCILLVVPVTVVIERAVDALLTERPVFRPTSVRRLDARPTVVGGVLMIVYVLAGLRFADESWLELLAYLALFAVLLLLSVVDVAEYRLPDAVVLPALVAGILAVVLVSVVDGDPERIRFAGIGAVVAFVVLLAAHLVSPRGMGFGDVKLAALLGLAVGWQAVSTLDAVVLVLWMLLVGFGIGSLAGVVLWIVRKGNAPFPFGPFLALGTVITVLLSGTLVR